MHPNEKGLGSRDGWTQNELDRSLYTETGNRLVELGANVDAVDTVTGAIIDPVVLRDRLRGAFVEWGAWIVARALDGEDMGFAIVVGNWKVGGVTPDFVSVETYYADTLDDLIRFMPDHIRKLTGLGRVLEGEAL